MPIGSSILLDDLPAFYKAYRQQHVRQSRKTALLSFPFSDAALGPLKEFEQTTPDAVVTRTGQTYLSYDIGAQETPHFT